MLPLSSATAIAVHGRDAGRDAYRVSTRVAGHATRALVPECLMAGLRPGDRPTHQEAYEWIAAHSAVLHKAIAALAAGTTPRPPYDLVSLEGAP